MKFPAAAMTALAMLAVAAAGSAADRAPVTPELRAVSGPQLREEIAAVPGVAVVNVWATWCVPCREEFPALLRLRSAYRDRGIALLLVSGDFSSQRQAALDFLGESGVDFPTYIKSGKDMEFIEALHGDWSGALPATFVYAPGGELVEWWQGAASYEKFAAAVERVLAQSDKEKP